MRDGDIRKEEMPQELKEGNNERNGEKNKRRERNEMTKRDNELLMRGREVMRQ